jgi:hypothetical protein
MLGDIIDTIKGVIKSCNLEASSGNFSAFIADIFKDLWPYLGKNLEIYYDNEEIVESICQLVKYSMRAMKNTFYELYMKKFLEKILSGFQLKPVSSYLYSFEVIVDAYYNDSRTQKMLLETFEFFCNLTFTYLPTLSS